MDNFLYLATFSFFMAKAKNVVSSQGTGTKQVTLPVIARQQMHAVRSVADQVEKDSPGAIHAVHALQLLWKTDAGHHRLQSRPRAGRWS